MNPKVSILVPVYNASSYIERCVHSLFKQKLSGIEYIFVNDATPDDSMEKLYSVIEQYPERKDAVKIIEHSVNKGSSASRNAALDASSGEYIAAVDSDDYIDPEMMEVLYEKAKKEDADIVVSDLIAEYPEKSVFISDFVDENREKRLHDILVNEISQGYSCNKLIRRKIYQQENCRAPEGLNYLEDRHTITRLYYYATKVVKVDRAFYHYTQSNPNAITKRKGRMHFQNVILFWRLLDDFLIEKGLYEKYEEELNLSKLKNKCRLMCDTSSYLLRKEYAGMFAIDEKKYLNHFKTVERVMLLFIRYRMFTLAHLLHKMLWFKNRKLPQLFNKNTK